MNLDELSPLWEQSSIEQASAKSEAELQQILDQRTDQIQLKIRKNNQRTLISAILGLVGGLVLLMLASDGFQDENSVQAFSKLFLLQTAVIAFFWFIKRSLRFELYAHDLAKRLTYMISKMSNRMWVEMSFFFILFPGLMWALASWNHSVKHMYELLLEQPILGLSLVGFVVMGGLIWHRYQQPLRELKACLRNWQQLTSHSP